MASTWKTLANPPPFPASTMLLLTDGTVMCQQAGGVSWARLTPDAQGSYLQGTWSAMAPMHYTRLYYASAVLADGRVFVAGGEYSNAGSETNTAEIYDPATDTWTPIAAPSGWVEIGDAPCAVLPDGRVLLGDINSARAAIYDPVANTWAATGAKGDQSSEESWVLMADNTVLTPQCSAHPRAEKYVVGTNTWVSAGQTPADLVEAASIEIGPGVLLPDGRAFYVGATPNTALYQSGATASGPGTWTAGPGVPNDLNNKSCGAKDAPACLLVSGNVLLTVGPVDGTQNGYLGPTYFYEFDGAQLIRVADAPNAASVPYAGRMLLLPTGEVLYTGSTKSVCLYTAPAIGSNAWRPKIQTVSKVLDAGSSFTLMGTQLNGLSQAVAYGDDASAATNYPIVRLEAQGGAVYYCKTFGHSTMGVATGASPQYTTFAVPLSCPKGFYTLTVVANGIPSLPTPVTVGLQRYSGSWPELWNWIIGSLADGPQWVIGPNGPIPVDPWGPKWRGEVAALRKEAAVALRTLRRIGSQVEAARTRIAMGIPVARDDAAATAGVTARAAVARASRRSAPKARKGKSQGRARARKSRR